ncbi:MAG: endopeptidase La [Oscillospiraceae bacterium]|nr:endopeptidase La [Oscillospiraceae bacterium]
MKKTLESSTVRLPLLAMRGMVLFPQMVLHFDVGRDKSIYALNEAMGRDRMIFLSAQKDIRDEDPDGDGIYEIGVVGEVKQIIKSNDHLRVLVEGRYRAKSVELIDKGDFFEACLEEYPLKSNKGASKKMTDALMRTVKDLFQEYGMMTPRMSKDLTFNAMAADDPVFLSEYIAANMPIHTEDKQVILEESSVTRRLRLLVRILEEENDILSLEQEIHEKVRGQIDTNQREYYLREQIKAISAELGDGENAQEDIYEYHMRIDELIEDDETAEKLHKEADRLSKMPYTSHEAGVIKSYLDNVLELPWGKFTKDKIDIDKAEKQLNRDHYGMEKVKERILEQMSVRALAPDIKGQIICLAGPPGVGKTSVAKSIAKSMGRKYVRLSLGGVRDESDIRGHRKTYIGAMPGRIMAALKQSGSSNPLMLLDEVDKLGNDFRGDPSSALLEVLDSEQNYAFRDHYLEVPFDLSKVMFIATANSLGNVPRPLLDRMEVIHLTSYTREEKLQIAKKHLTPKQMKRHGLNAKTFKLQTGGIYSLIDSYTREAGVRGLEREIASLCRKAAKRLVSGQEEAVNVSSKNITQFLGGQKYKKDILAEKDEIGLANGLAWTSVGGEMLQIEVAVLEGSGKTVLTGSLGEVMKESAQAAISYIRICTEKYGIEKDFHKTRDIHIHLPEGAVPKDGPSAGITLCTALLSALSGIPVRADVAMTGEMSLRGRVLPIGGLKEKAMAAYRYGIKTVIIPEENVVDLEEVDDAVKQGIQFVSASHVKQVLDVALTRKFAPRHEIAPPPIKYSEEQAADVAITIN